MKKTLLTLTFVAASVAAFAQGKITFGNDSNHYFVLGRPTAVLPADVGIAGGVASTAGNTVSGTAGAIPATLPSGVTLVAALYAGTTAGNLSQVYSINLDSTGWFQAGRVNNKTMTLTGIPGGVAAFFRVDVYDNKYASAALSQAAGSYSGSSGQFSMVPGASFSYPSLTTATSPVNSTWGAGNVVIEVVPEPSTFALAGLGAAAMLIFRRRK